MGTWTAPAALVLLAISGVAQADPPGFVPGNPWCGYESLAQETVTGGSAQYQGISYGYIVAATPGDPVSIRCYVTVDGVEATSTPAGSGTTLAVAFGEVAFAAGDEQTLALCADWTDGERSGTSCRGSDTITIPPSFDILPVLPPPIECPYLASLSPGVPGVVDIGYDGDVTVPQPVGKLWDCPPYDVY